MREPKTCLLIHCIWATWDRLPILIGERRDTAYRCIEAECKALRANMLAIGGTDNHVHLLVEIPATLPVSLLMKNVKGSTSHLVNTVGGRKEFFKWQGAYAAYSVGHTELSAVIGYIQNQEQHHGARTTVKDFELPEPQLTKFPVSAGTLCDLASP